MKSLKLPADLRIASAAALRDRLASALEGEGPLRLQGADVTRADLAGVQVLMAAAAEARRCGRDLRLAAPAGPLAEAVQLLGLAETLPLPRTRAGERRAPKD